MGVKWNDLNFLFGFARKFAYSRLDKEGGLSKAPMKVIIIKVELARASRHYIISMAKEVMAQETTSKSMAFHISRK